MKKIFALAAFALMGAAVVTFNACTDDPEASPLNADLSSTDNTVLLEGVAYYPADSAKSKNTSYQGNQKDTLALVPASAGAELLISIPYGDPGLVPGPVPGPGPGPGQGGLGIKDASGSYVAGDWTQKVQVGTGGTFSLRVPVNAQYIPTNVSILALPFNGIQKQPKAGDVEGTFNVATYHIVEGGFVKGYKKVRVEILYTNFTPKPTTPVVY